MMPCRAAVVHAIAIATCVLSSASLAAAGDDTTQAPGANGQGPIIIERIQSGFLGAPDVKVTSFDHQTSTLIGGYAGWLSQETFFIGGAGYWLADNSRNRSMAYGGLDVGWLGRSGRLVSWGVKSLIGFGEATVSETVVFPYLPYPPIAYPDPRDNVARVLTGPPIGQVQVRHNFFVFEPEASISMRMSKHLRLTYGGGYRAVSTGHHGDSLSGAVGSVSLQIGGGS